MEKYVEVRSSIKKDDKSFVLHVVRDLSPFKIEIVSEEFCDKIAETIASTNGAVTSMDDVVEGIHKPVEMNIDAELYKTLCDLAEKDEVELVLRYVAVHRITTCDEDKGFIGMISHARDALKKVPLHMRHVLTSKDYYRFFALIPMGYLASVCNLSGVRVEVGKMDKSTEKNAVMVMDALKEQCVCEENALSEAYRAIDEVVERILFAYRDKNLIDLWNLTKVLKDSCKSMDEYFGKLIKKMDCDLKDTFGKFSDLVKQMKESDSQELSQDTLDPMDYDQVDMSSDEEENTTAVDAGDMSIIDTMNPPEQNVNAGLDENGGEQPGGGEDQNTPATQPGAGGVVTGLESVLFEEGFGIRKKLKRISRDSIGYVRVRGSNAQDVDTLCMVVSYGYSIVDRCEWYMELIQSGDSRYVVPQSYGELESIKNQMTAVLDDLMKNPIVKKRNIVLDYYGV